MRILSTPPVTRIAIVMGSKNDWPTMKHAADMLTHFEVLFHCEIISAHRTPDKLFTFSEQASEKGYQVIIAGAGGSAHLPGMLASKTLIPVLGVPIESTILSGIDSLLSILQMPRGAPVGTLAIGKTGAANAALLAVQILALYNTNLTLSLSAWRENEKNKILNHPDPRDKL
ncbi:5-(carboxyamino)imidazole ribonucleotide mutase [Candidatus Erwinia haradaeae]|uniref:5-(carboxyamino)imidazole ribonucleotide mutase n=1 Tax=Candidatus Erwinia haradaeae TaxID=1922217 RepID=UPI00130047EB|nr:5-(carboxyamino)imidazole ribonucleotide mutase [Candidatus Erwinia haradaeae]